MKFGWTETTLGAVCFLQSGAGFPIEYQGQSEGRYPFFKVSDMNLEGNEIAFVRANNYVSDEVRASLGARIFPAGSVLFPKVGGAIATNKKRKAVQPSCVDNNVMGLIPKPGLIDPDFLFQWINGFDLYDFSNKANPPSITQGTVSSWPIVLPPLDEQKRIVAVLDQAFAALDRVCANAEANLQDADQLLRRELSELFGREDASEVEIRTLFDVGSSKRVLKSQWETTSGVPFYRGREVTKLSMHGFVENELFISEEHFEELKTRYGVPVAGDIVITAIGTIGNAHVVRQSDRFYFKDASVLWMKKVGDVSSEYVLAWLKSPQFTEQLDAGNGATVDTLTIQKLQCIKIRVPSIEQQHRIVAKLNSLRAEVSQLQASCVRKVEDIKELRASLLQAAFSGQLT